MQNTFLQRGGLWVLAQFALLLAILVSGFFWCHQWHHLSLTVLGAVLLLISAVFGIAGALALHRNLSPFPHPSPKSQLVTTGIYRLVRHPLYTSVLSGSLGWALLVESWPSLVFALLLAPFLAAKARSEERLLLSRFPEYASYRKSVPRFIPWLY